MATKNATQMTRKEAATIMKKYEKNGMVTKVTDEYLNAKKIYKERVKAEKIPTIHIDEILNPNNWIETEISSIEDLQKFLNK